MAINVFGNGQVICISTQSDELIPIRVVNNGSVILTNMQLVVVIPAGLAYFSSTPSLGTFDGIDTWTIPSLGIGVMATLELCFTVTNDSLQPWEITYTATVNEAEGNILDNDAERNFSGLSCSEFTNCFLSCESLQEFDSMALAIAALGGGEIFIASLTNLEGWPYRTLLMTPCGNNPFGMSITCPTLEEDCSFYDCNNYPNLFVPGGVNFSNGLAEEFFPVIVTGSCVNDLPPSTVLTFDMWNFDHGPTDPFDDIQYSIDSTPGQFILSFVFNPETQIPCEGGTEDFTTQTYTYTITDPCGNTASCTFLWVNPSC